MNKTTFKSKNGSPVATVMPLNTFWGVNRPEFNNKFAFAVFGQSPRYVGGLARALSLARAYVSTLNH